MPARWLLFWSMTAALLKSEWLRGLIDYFFPPLCLGCGAYTESDYGICENCLRAIDSFTRTFCLNCLDTMPSGSKCLSCSEMALPLYAYGNYTSPLKEIIIQYKFKGLTTAPSALFARLICERFQDSILAHGCDTLVPIPLYPSRENYRGYNQAVIFARQLARTLGFTVNSGIISRVKKRKPQSRLNLTDRARNIRGVFQAEVEAGENDGIILVDDVVTSGSTVREAKSTLEKAGYRVVAAIAIAHAV